jgi:hypothetical protein
MTAMAREPRPRRAGRRLNRAFLAVAVVVSLPIWLPWTCPLQRLLITADKRALIALKNRTALPTAGDYDLRATLTALVAPGADEARWSAQRAAVVEGYVIAVQPAGMELANCLSFTRRDIHVDVGLGPDAAPRERLILEVTPPMRDWARRQGMDWSAGSLRALVGKRARFEGWLMFDREHEQESENSRPGQPGNWRATAWEVHPITSIKLLTPRLTSVQYPSVQTPLHSCLSPAYHPSRWMLHTRELRG